VEETGFGNVPDKTTKNRLASVDVPRAMAGMRTIGVIGEDRDKGIVEVASPVGVVAAVIPSTNPTSTAIYNTLIALKSGNALVLSPHPSAMRAICETAGILSRAALSAGCPEGLIGCMQHTTLAGTRELMSHRDVGVILATGGTGLVRAAYGSGKPAYGVGPGNVPAFIERTADVRKAIGDIFAGKTFDYGTICSSEQAIVVEEGVREAALEECRKQGAHLLSSEEAQAVAEYERGWPARDGHCGDGRHPGAALDARAHCAPCAGASRAGIPALRGEALADFGVLRRGQFGCRHRALPAPAGVRRARPYLCDSFRE
jgi:acyl-CoA reductase-like NAD-dependent aldehyde dehydrogenase